MSTASRVTRILVVANETSTSRALLDAVARRAREGACSFTLLVPATARGLHRLTDPEDHGLDEAEARVSAAVPVLSEAAGHPIAGIVGSHNPLAAVEDALNVVGFDEVILSMLPARLSRWLHLDLPHKVRALGVPVTEVVASEPSLTGLTAA